MITVSEEEAGMLVGAAAAIIMFEKNIGERAKADPRAMRHLAEAQESIKKAMDRIFRADPKLVSAVRKRVIVLDDGKVGTMAAYKAAVQAFNEARPKTGGGPSQAKFKKALSDKLMPMAMGEKEE